MTAMAPCPYPQVSPNYTQGHPRSPKVAQPGSPASPVLARWGGSCAPCFGQVPSTNGQVRFLLSKNSSLLALRHSHHSAFRPANKVRNVASAKQCRMISDKSTIAKKRRSAILSSLKDGISACGTIKNRLEHVLDQID